MAKILANDGIAAKGRSLLEQAGHEVTDRKYSQEELFSVLPGFDAVLVRSATKIRKELIDACPNLRLIGRGGVGLDNIDMDYARGKGIEVVNTPAASSRSVAELVLAHLLTGLRFLHQTNRKMPLEGNTNFKGLKKACSKGHEALSKTIGIIGFGRIGQSLASMSLGLGMKVLAYDPFVREAEIALPVSGLNDKVMVTVQTVSMDQLLAESDFISLHVPATDKPVVDAAAFAKMKDGVALINAARGGVVDEIALLDALNSGKVAFAGIDVFENEPEPRKELLEHPNVSLSPHIGASTVEAQDNVWTEMAEKVIAFFNQ